MKADGYPIDVKRITGLDDVLRQLEALDSSLQSANLGQFKLFNSAYSVVTSNIDQAIKSNYFANPKFIERFTVTFASYYFNAVNDTLAGSKKLTAPWAKLCELNPDASPVFVSLLMGANAHINYDLPQVLLRLMKKEATDDLFSDLVKIDTLLMKSGVEILRLFEEPGRKLDFLKRNFKPLYYRPIMYMILYWRAMAWRNYRRLKRSNTTLIRVHKRSNKIANRFLRITKV